MVELVGHRSRNNRRSGCIAHRVILENGMNRQVDAMIVSIVNAGFDAVRFTVQIQLSSAVDEQLQTSKRRRILDNVDHTPAPGCARAA